MKISPNPSLPKRGIINPPLKKGHRGGFEAHFQMKSMECIRESRQQKKNEIH
jgi:hypothetical protein